MLIFEQHRVSPRRISWHFSHLKRSKLFRYVCNVYFECVTVCIVYMIITLAITVTLVLNWHFFSNSDTVCRKMSGLAEAIRRCNLQLKLDNKTEGYGNCFPNAIIQQCRRPEINNWLRENNPMGIFKSPQALRRQVTNFA